MESLHSTEAVCSENNHYDLRNPATLNDFESARLVLQTILKANLQEDVRSHVLCKFFEELGNLSMGMTKTEGKESLNARDIKEDFSQFIDKILSSGFSSSLEKTKEKRLPKVMQDAEDETLEVPSMASTPLTLAKASFKEGTVDTKQGETTYHNILSFLKEASACGAIVLNDAESVFHCFNNVFSGKREVHMLKEKTSHAKGEEEIFGASHLAGSLNKGDGLKERENSLCPMDIGPPGKSFCAVSKDPADTRQNLCKLLSASTCKKDDYTMPKDSMNSPHNVKEVCSPCSHFKSQKDHSIPICADGRDHEGRHILQAISKSTFSGLHPTVADLCGDKADICSKANGNHVTTSPNPLNFLEAAKQALKSSSSPTFDKGTEGKSASSSHVTSDFSPLFKVDNGVFLKRMEMCKFSVLGKVTLVKGDDPWTWSKLKEKLDVLWGLKSRWRLISLGKGFFHIILNSQEELNSVWSKGVLHLKPGVLRIQRWTFGFDPSNEKTTTAQVWFRIHHLPWCLWDPSIINGILQKVGVPLRIDKTTLEGNYGHYARALVEVDVSKPLMSSVLLECDNKFMEIKIVPENLPIFCKGCNSIGHVASDCKFLNKLNNGPYSSKQATAESSSLDRNDNFNKLKRTSQLPEWRKKEVNVTGKVNSTKVSPTDQGTTIKTSNVNSKEGPSKTVFNSKSIAETITDFDEDVDDGMIGKPQRHDSKEEHNSPRVLPYQGSKNIRTSNMFSALEEHDDMETGKENKVIQNCDIDEVKCDDKVQKVPLSKGDVDHTLKGIRMWAEQEKRNIFQQAENSGQIGEKGVEECLTPKTPKRWSDIQDEEEEKEAHEANPKVFAPQHDDILSFERNGEIAEIFMSTGRVRFTPISNKSKN